MFQTYQGYRWGEEGAHGVGDQEVHQDLGVVARHHGAQQTWALQTTETAEEEERKEGGQKEEINPIFSSILSKY